MASRMKTRSQTGKRTGAPKRRFQEIDWGILDPDLLEETDDEKDAEPHFPGLLERSREENPNDPGDESEGTSDGEENDNER